MAFGRWLRVAGSRLDAASLVLGQGSLVTPWNAAWGLCALRAGSPRVGDSSAVLLRKGKKGKNDHIEIAGDH